MKVVADCDIPFVNEAFQEFGEVITIPGREITQKVVKDALALIVRSVTKVDKHLLENTSVKFVGTATAGTDHIDIDYLKDKNIGFTCTPGSNARSVAEYIICALLHLSHTKKIPLKNSTLGLIGVGNIGSKVFKMAQTLGINCILNDPPKRKLTGSDFYKPLDEILKKSDIISLSVPLITQGQYRTEYLVSKDFITKLKNDTILINTSRGRIVNEKQLINNIHKFRGLVFDVWYNEPNINIELLKLIDIGTPHIAGYSYDGKLLGTEMVYNAACAFFFKEKKWKRLDVLSKFKSDVFDMGKLKDRIFEATLKAYPILKDSQKFKEIINLKEDKRGEYFDTFRKNYYKRLNFSHVKIKENSIPHDDKNTLLDLGFTLY